MSVSTCQLGDAHHVRGGELRPRGHGGAAPAGEEWSAGSGRTAHLWRPRANLHQHLPPHSERQTALQCRLLLQPPHLQRVPSLSLSPGEKVQGKIFVSSFLSKYQLIVAEAECYKVSRPALRETGQQSSDAEHIPAMEGNIRGDVPGPSS